MTRLAGDKPTRGRAKTHLPQKTCATCARRFAWRKKWERDWEGVRYCSERCRRRKPARSGGAS